MNAIIESPTTTPQAVFEREELRRISELVDPKEIRKAVNLFRVTHDSQDYLKMLRSDNTLQDMITSTPDNTMDDMEAFGEMTVELAFASQRTFLEIATVLQKRKSFDWLTDDVIDTRLRVNLQMMDGIYEDYSCVIAKSTEDGIDEDQAIYRPTQNAAISAAAMNLNYSATNAIEIMGQRIASYDDEGRLLSVEWDELEGGDSDERNVVHNEIKYGENGEIQVDNPESNLQTVAQNLPGIRSANATIDLAIAIKEKNKNRDEIVEELSKIDPERYRDKLQKILSVDENRANIIELIADSIENEDDFIIWSAIFSANEAWQLSNCGVATNKGDAKRVERLKHVVSILHETKGGEEESTVSEIMKDFFQFQQGAIQAKRLDYELDPFERVA